MWRRTFPSAHSGTPKMHMLFLLDLVSRSIKISFKLLCSFNAVKRACFRLTSQSNPTSWSSQLSCVEYSHNSYTCAAAGLSHFEISLGYPPHLFPSDERLALTPSLYDHLQCCKRTGSKAIAVINNCTREQNIQTADRRRLPTPTTLLGWFCFLPAIFILKICVRSFHLGLLVQIESVLIPTSVPFMRS